MWTGHWDSMSKGFCRLLDCKRHQHRELEDVRDIILHYRDSNNSKFLWYVRIQILGPFLFEQQYELDVLTQWGKAGGILPKEGYIPDGRINKEVKDAVVLVDSLACNFLRFIQELAVAAHYCPSAKSRLKGCKRRAREIEKLDFDDARKCVANDDIFKMFRNCLSAESEVKVVATYIICYKLYFVSEETEDAKIEDFEKRREHDLEQVNVFKDLGNGEYNQKQYIQAIASYTKAIKTCHFSSILYCNRAQAYLKLDKWDEAEMDGRRSIVLQPEWCKAYYRLGQSLEGQDKIHAAHGIIEFGSVACLNNACKERAEMVPFLETLQEKCRVSDRCSKIKAVVNSKETPSSVPNILKQGGKDVKLNGRPAKPALTVSEPSDVPDLISDSSDSENANDNPKAIHENNGDMSSVIKDKTPVCKDNSTPVVTFFNTSKPSAQEASGLSELKNTNAQLKQAMKEGSLALIQGLNRNAVAHFQKALSLVSTSSMEYFGLSESDIVILKYAYGIACVEIGVLEELQKSVTIFEEILDKHENIRFPPIYYGLGLAYRRMNRFKEALKPLEMGLKIIQKRLPFDICAWPGTTTIIEESRSKKLEQVLNELIVVCHNPPSPDAMCRFEECKTARAMYYCSLDFKGFTRVSCQDRCCLEYHPACWKTLKDALATSEKSMLGQSCSTPDCAGTIVRIAVINKDGETTKEFVAEQAAKPDPVKHRKTKLEKKMEQKELKKRRKLEHQTKPTSEHQDMEDEDDMCSKDDESEISSTSGTRERTNSIALPDDDILNGDASATDKKVVIEKKVDEKPTSSKVVPITTSEGMEPAYVLKREREETKIDDLRTLKSKGRKQRSKYVMSLDEFRGDMEDDALYNDYLGRLERLKQTKLLVEEGAEMWPALCAKQRTRIPQLDPDRPFYIPEGLRDDPEALEAVLQSFSAFGESDTTRNMRENILSYLENLIKYEGPMPKDHPKLMQELENFPPEARTLVNQYGGLLPFLLQSLKFVLIHDVIHVVNPLDTDDDFVDDPLSRCGKMDSLDMFEDPLSDEVDTVVHNTHSLHRGATHRFSLNLTANSYCPDELTDHSASYDSDTTVKLSPRAITVKDNYKDLNTHKLCADTWSSCPFSNIDSEDFVDFPQRESAGFSGNRLDTNQKNNFEDFNMLDLETPQCKWSEGDEVLNSVLPDNTKNLMSGDNVEGSDSNIDIKLIGDFKQIIKQLRDIMKDLTLEQQVELTASIVDTCAVRSDMRSHWLQKLSDQIKTVRVLPYIRTLCKGVLTDVCQSSYRTVGTMKEDEQFQQLLDLTDQLTSEKDMIEGRLDHALDQVNQLKSKTAVEKDVLEKRIENLESQNQSLELDVRIQQQKLEQEKKRWQQEKLKLKEKADKVDAGKVAEARLQDLNSELISTLASIKTELTTEREHKEEMEENLKMLLEQNENALARAKGAEVQLIQFKKDEFLRQFGRAMDIVNNSLIQLDQYSSRFPDVMQYQHDLAQWKVHKNDMQKLREDFVGKADKQLEACRRGQTLSDLEPLAIPKFPNPPPSYHKSFNFHPSPLLVMPSPLMRTPVMSGAQLMRPVAQSSGQSLQATDAEVPMRRANIGGTGRPSASNPPPGLTKAAEDFITKPTYVHSAAQATDSSHVASSLMLNSGQPATATHAIYPSVTTRSTQPSSVMPTTQFSLVSHSVPPRKAPSPPVQPIAKLEAASRVSPSPPAAHAAGELKMEKLTREPADRIDRPPPMKPVSRNEVEGGSYNHLTPISLTDPPMGSNPAFGGSVLELHEESGNAPMKNSYEKLIAKIQAYFPHMTSSELTMYIKKFRNQRNKLSGMTIDTITAGVVEMIQQEQRSGVPSARPLHAIHPPIPRFEHLRQPSAALLSNPRTVERPEKVKTWAKPEDTTRAWKGQENEQDNSCSICLEELSPHTLFVVECKHTFHRKCIQEWLTKDSTCPICRVHILLPDEFPALGEM